MPKLETGQQPPTRRRLSLTLISAWAVSPRVLSYTLTGLVILVHAVSEAVSGRGTQSIVSGPSRQSRTRPGGSLGAGGGAAGCGRAVPARLRGRLRRCLARLRLVLLLRLRRVLLLLALVLPGRILQTTYVNAGQRR